MKQLESTAASFEGLRSREEGAWNEFSTRFGERLRRYFHRLGVRRDEADDLSQDVLGVVFRRIGAVRDPGRLDHWVLAIARNLLRSRRRRRRPEPESIGDDGGASLVADGPAPDAGDDDLRITVRAELRSMPPSARALLETRVLEGRSSGEAWLVLGLTPEQQRRRLYVALKELRRRLGERLGAAYLEA